MPRVAALIIIIISLALRSLATAQPEPAGPSRVVLADSDPELLKALVTALAPWRLTVVVDPVPPADLPEASERAEQRTAQFVVWRGPDELVVFDRRTATLDRRAAPSGALDPVSAAAAALTVKTMMRLPSLEVAKPQPPSRRSSSQELRVQAGLLGRAGRGSQTELAPRGELTILVRPSTAWGWRFGIGGDAGTSLDIEHAGFRGTWRDWAIVGIASWAHLVGNWELDPWMAGGFVRGTLSGVDSSELRHESVAMGVLRAGVTARYRLGIWTIGASIGVDLWVKPVTYFKTGSAAIIYTAPSFSLVTGIVAAVDLGS